MFITYAQNQLVSKVSVDTGFTVCHIMHYVPEARLLYQYKNLNYFIRQNMGMRLWITKWTSSVILSTEYDTNLTLHKLSLFLNLNISSNRIQTIWDPIMNSSWHGRRYKKSSQVQRSALAVLWRSQYAIQESCCHKRELRSWLMTQERSKVG